MQYRPLGNTGIFVSRLGMGTLTLGPLQANLPLELGAQLIIRAYGQGINLFDTAELYRTYDFLAEALRVIPREKMVISTKTYAYTRQGAEESLRLALESLGTDYVDIFLLHEQESEQTLRGHCEALETLLEYKRKGHIRAVGISTHTIQAVKAASNMPEIDVIFPIFNYKGLGIKDGSIDEMVRAVRYAHQKGKGIYAMKVFGGGHLIREIPRALEFALSFPEVGSAVVGMKSFAEQELLLALAGGEKVDFHPEEIAQKKKLWIDEDCSGCNNCVETCPQGALSLVKGKSSVDHGKCILCGYCGPVCEDFYIKVV